MNVLSVFDGMSCGQIALNRADIMYNKYFASEINKNAVKVCQKNYPNTIQLGDVTKIKGSDLPKIDLLIGGSPCQGFSFAGGQLNFNDERSKLFFEFVRLKNESNPIHFLLENVKMKKEYKDIISDYLGVQPVEINSSLFSGQNRPRLYWTNIPIKPLPQDKGITVGDILQDDSEIDSKYMLSDKAIAYMSRLRKDKPRWEYHTNPLNGKAACLTANMWKGVPYGVIKEKLRRLTPIECERLQTIGDNMTQFCLSTDYLYICKETNILKKWEQNVKLLNAEEIFQIEKQTYVTNIIYDLLELEQLKKELLKKILTVRTLDVKINKKLLMGIVLLTTKDGPNTEQLIYQKNLLKETTNVNIVIELLESGGVLEECVIDTTLIGLDIKTLYSQIINAMKLNQEDITAKLMVRNATGQLWRISWEETLNMGKLCIILTLIKQIIVSKIYTYTKIKTNIKSLISNWEILGENCINVELLDLRMENITLNSNTARYEMLGNGWTVDVISHIFSGLK